MRTTSLTLHCTTGREQNILNNLEIELFQWSHHSRQLQEESSKVQEQRGCEGLEDPKINFPSKPFIFLFNFFFVGSSDADQSRCQRSQPR